MQGEFDIYIYVFDIPEYKHLVKKGASLNEDNACVCVNAGGMVGE